ncbi:hypothetical protein RQP46_006234 [Phenoliferia psychrophenolica]
MSSINGAPNGNGNGHSASPLGVPAALPPPGPASTKVGKVTSSGAILTGGYNTHKVYIGNLPETATLADLEDCFGQLGQCTCSIKRGFGFVEYTEAASAAEAVAKYHEGHFLGAQIKVELSLARQAPPKPVYGADDSKPPSRNPPGSDRPSDSRKPMFINGPPAADKLPGVKPPPTSDATGLPPTAIPPRLRVRFLATCLLATTTETLATARTSETREALTLRLLRPTAIHATLIGTMIATVLATHLPPLATTGRRLGTDLRPLSIPAIGPLTPATVPTTPTTTLLLTRTVVPLLPLSRDQRDPYPSDRDRYDSRPPPGAPLSASPYDQPGRPSYPHDPYGPPSGFDDRYDPRGAPPLPPRGGGDDRPRYNEDRYEDRSRFNAYPRSPPRDDRRDTYGGRSPLRGAPSSDRRRSLSPRRRDDGFRGSDYGPPPSSSYNYQPSYSQGGRSPPRYPQSDEYNPRR